MRVLKRMMCTDTVTQRDGMGCGGKWADAIDLEEAFIVIFHVIDYVGRLCGRL